MNDENWKNYINNLGNAFLPQINFLLKKGYKNLNITHSRGKPLFTLSLKQWINVLNLFSNDLDRIILNSKELDDNIYCYRGVSNHYINVAGYTFCHQTSFTFSYDIAYKFHNNDLNENKCIYRTTILKGSKALFLAPISANKEELEILIPSNSTGTFIFNIDENGNINKAIDSYNNYKNKYSICSNNKNVFKSIDLIILTPTTYTDKFEINNDMTLDDTITDKDTLSIVTVNINEKNNIDIIDKIIKNEPKIICIQESNQDLNINMDLNDYELIISNENKMHERIDIYKNKSSDIIINSNDKINTKLCNTKRTDIIIETIYKETPIKIGVVHLCGGRYDENEIIKSSNILKFNYDDEDEDERREYDILLSNTMTKIDENIKFINSLNHSYIKSLSDEEKNEQIELYKQNEVTHFNEEFNKLFNIKKIKIEQIKQMIDKKVDIILGDFNSDFEYFLGNSNQNQINYLTQLKFTDKMINIWNNSVYELLERNNYISFCNDNIKCKKFYETIHTSIYELSPDVIYYKKDSNIKIQDYYIIDLISSNLSDHNGIYVNFKIKKETMGGRKKKCKK